MTMKDLLISNSLNIIGYSGYKDSGQSLPLQKKFKHLHTGFGTTRGTAQSSS